MPNAPAPTTRTERNLLSAAREFEMARRHAMSVANDFSNLDIVAAALLIAARIVSLEDAITEGLPTAGEGI